MDYQRVPITQSIGVELLKKIFGVYCIAALLITFFQAWLEYSQTKDRVIQLMIEHQPLVEESLANALWHLDQPLLNSLLKGTLSQRIIVGVQIFTDDGTLLAKAGRLPPSIGALSTTARDIQPQHNSYRHQFVLFDPTELTEEPIGTAVFHTANDVVIEEVKPRLISLLAAALLKTAILWVVFIYFGQKLLSRPLHHLIAMVRKLPLEKNNPRTVPINAKLNELQLFEFALLDTTQKLKKTLKSLRSTNQQLSKINVHLLRAVEQSPTLSVILTLSGQVEYATPSFSELTGYSTKQIQDLFSDHLLDDMDFNPLIEQQQHQDGQHKPDFFELKILDKRQQCVYLTANICAVYSEQGHIVNFLFSATNISSNKQLQVLLKQKNLEQQRTISHLKEAKSQLLQSEKMASVGLLAAGISHEINNPLAFIYSNNEALANYHQQLFQLIDYYQEYLAQSLNGHRQLNPLADKINYKFLAEDISLINKESQEGLDRIKDIVANLLFFSRADDGQFESYDLRKGLQSTINIAWLQLKNNSSIVRELNDIPTIECIPRQINQVFMNLLINASQSFIDSGTITIRTKVADQHVIVEIEDDGPGIEPQYLNKLFDPFFTTKEVGLGTGLGLSVSYGIIKKHHGDIHVTSQMGQGTCFTIILPMDQ